MMTVIRIIVISVWYTGNVSTAIAVSVTIATSTKKASRRYIPAIFVGSATVLNVWLISAKMETQT